MPRIEFLNGKIATGKIEFKEPKTSSLFKVTPSEFIEKGADAIRRISKGAPATLQFLGGLAGGAIAGKFLGRPFLGGAVGGTIARGAGEILKEQAQIAPFRTVAQFVPQQFLPIRQQPPILPPEARGRIFRGTGRAALTEAGAAAIAAPLGRTFKFIGRGAMKALQGSRVAERAAQRGWKALLNPSFYKGRIPRFVADGVDKFFSRLTRTTGSAIDDVLKAPKISKVRVSIKDIKSKVKNILPKEITIDDFDVSSAQKKLLQRETNNILRMGGKSRKLTTIWEQRKALDKLIFGQRWKDESLDYLRKLRRILNEPLITSGDEVKEAFSRYAFVKEAEDDFGKTFQSIIRRDTGETFSSKLETFLGNVLSTSKDETLRILKELDSLLGDSDKIIEHMLDFSASEMIEKGPAIGIGIFQRMFTGMLGGRKTLAGLGKLAGAKITRGLFRGIGRAVPTAITEVGKE